MPRVLLYLAELSDAGLARLRELAPSPEWRIERTRDRDELFRELLPSAEVVIGFLSEENVRRAENLRWLQLGSAGANRHVERTPAHVTLTCARGVHGVPVAEHALALLLGLLRNIPAMTRNAADRRWQRPGGLDELHGRVCGLLGFGDIGQHLARLLTPFEAKLLAFNRRGQRSEIRHQKAENTGEKSEGREQRSDPIVEVLPLSALDEHLPSIDHLLISLPGTPATDHVIDARRLALMKPTARIVNVGRGSVIDEAALIETLRENRLAGAALDVFETEPLPEASPLWSLPNVIISPHVAGGGPRFAQRLAALAADNLARYVRGEPLLNVVDREWGY